MATKKISQFDSLAQGDLDPAADVLPIVDTGSVETKKITAKALAGGAVADLVAVWNNVATTFSAIKMDVTDTASAAGSMLLNLLVGGAARFQVTKAGNTTAAGSIRSTSPSAGVGYATGAGGAETQLTSKATAVTLDKVCGTITMNNAVLNRETAVSFTLNNSAIAATDVVVVNIKSGATANAYNVGVTAVAAGSCRIQLHNILSGSDLSEAVVLQFAVIKAVAA
jgi:hypothetical protein